MWAWLAIALGTAAVAYAIWRTGLGYPGRPFGYRRLGRGEAAFLACAAESLYPPGGAIQPSGREADLPRYVDRLLDASQPRIRLLIHLLFFLVEHATIVFPAPGRGGRRRFSALDADQQLQVLEAWEKSPLFPRRVVFTSLRALLTLGYFAYPPVLRQLALAPLDFPTPVCEADLLFPPIGQPRSAVRHGPTDLTPPSDGTPLAIDGPLRAEYREAP